VTKKLKKKSVLISYLVGSPIGFCSILFVFFIPGMLTGEGLPTIAMAFVYGKATLGLTIAFLFSLWYAGGQVYNGIVKNKPLLEISFQYSLTINVIIWVVFLFISIIDNFNEQLFIIISLPILAFILCTLITTFTVGLLICFIIKVEIKTFKK
jgi:hypothetical protein